MSAFSLDDVLVRPDPDAVRAARAARPAPVATRHAVRTGEVAGVGVRVVEPDGPAAGVHVVAHSSGWCVGGPEQEDPLGDALAGTCATTCVSVDYRLAPEHPFPAGADDVHAVVARVLDDGGERVVLAGASAGAHLALLAALRLRDERPERCGGLAGLHLRYGCYDLGGTPSRRSAGDDALIVSPRRHASMVGHAFPGHDLTAADPAVSPLYADLRGLPPVRIDVGDRDPLLDDSLFVAARLAAAGVPVDLAVWAGCPHVFDALDPRLGADHAARVGAWISALARA